MWQDFHYCCYIVIAIGFRQHSGHRHCKEDSEGSFDKRTELNEKTVTAHRHW